MRFNIQQVALDAICLDDFFFRITTDKPINELVQSIRDIGLINPPLLIQNENTYIIVSGFRRIKAVSLTGEKKIAAQIVNSPKHSLDCAKIAISDNSFQRSLNLIEQARAIQLLSLFLNSRDDLTSAAKALLLPWNFSIMDKLRRILAFDEEIQQYVLEDTVSLSIALMLEKYREDGRTRIARLFNNLKLSLNKQREMITLIDEISCRDRMDVLEILEDKFFKEIIVNQDLDRNRKANKIRMALKKLRFPEITKAESDFFTCLRELNLDQSTKLIPPEFFEGSTYELNFLFSNFEELKICREKLQKIIQHPEIKKILER